MENNFIQMAVSTGHAVAYTIGSIFKHINRVQLYFINEYFLKFLFFIWKYNHFG